MSGVCRECERRAWLLDKLSVWLDIKLKYRDPVRLWDILELADLDVIDAVAGRRATELRTAYKEWQPAPSRVGEQPQALCRHHATYPPRLREDPLAPHSLELRGGAKRLRDMLDQKVVAIVGTRRASDYGMEVARELARGLAATGITVASDLAEGIPSAALAGALEAEGRPLAVMSGGVEQCTPAWCNSLYRSVLERGCSIGESRMRRRMRVWQRYASARTMALLAQLVIVVEATEQPWDTACANLGRSRTRYVAAVPGRVNASASRGTNALLMGGARLVRNAQDALNVLYGVGVCDADTVGGSFAETDLDPQLASVLELVSGGQDTLAKLASRTRSDDVVVALAELELRGLLSRGDGGRYVPSGSGFQGQLIPPTMTAPAEQTGLSGRTLRVPSNPITRAGDLSKDT